MAGRLRLQSVFPKDINEHTYDAYFEALKNWKIEYVEQAGQNLIKLGTFFPLPKDFGAQLQGIAWNDDIREKAREPVPRALTAKELLKIASCQK